jgi:hypothetical protein
MLRPNGSNKADALAWLESQHVDKAIAHSLWTVLPALWAEGYDLGLDAASDAAGFDGQVSPQGLEDLINAYGQNWVDQISRTTTERIATVLANSDGLTAGELEKQITDVLRDKGHAETIALTEVTRASGEASVAVYQAAAVDKVRWVTDPASNVCSLCSANEAAGPRFLGTPFPSGATAPPQHVRCRCALLPYRS